MEKVQLKEGHKNYVDALGITEMRYIDLKAHMDKVMIRIKNKQTDGTISSADIFNGFVSYAETPQELALLSFEAGQCVKELEVMHEQIFGGKSGWNAKIDELRRRVQKEGV